MYIYILSILQGYLGILQLLWEDLERDVTFLSESVWQNAVSLHISQPTSPCRLTTNWLSERFLLWILFDSWKAHRTYISIRVLRMAALIRGGTHSGTSLRWTHSIVKVKDSNTLHDSLLNETLACFSLYDKQENSTCWKLKGRFSLTLFYFYKARLFTSES